MQADQAHKLGHCAFTNEKWREVLNRMKYEWNKTLKEMSSEMTGIKLILGLGE